MNLEELRKYKPQILEIAARNGISDIRVFGSVARGEARDDSDVDLLVKVAPNVGWDFFGFHLDVEDLLHRKVDVVSDKAIKPRLREYILKDATPL